MPVAPYYYTPREKNLVRNPANKRKQDRNVGHLLTFPSTWCSRANTDFPYKLNFFYHNYQDNKPSLTTDFSDFQVWTGPKKRRVAAKPLLRDPQAG